MTRGRRKRIVPRLLSPVAGALPVQAGRFGLAQVDVGKIGSIYGVSEVEKWLIETRQTS